MPVPILKLVSCGLLVAATVCQAEIIVSPWQPIFKGVDFATAEADSNEPKLQQVAALRIDLSDPDIEFFSTPSNGEAPMETFGQTTTAFVETYGVSVGVNANFFSPVNTTPNDPRELTGLAISRGEIVSPPGEGRPTALITRSNMVTFAGVSPPDLQNYWTAVAGSGRLVRSGTNAADPDCVTDFCLENPRTALGVSQDGRYFYMLAIDGRRPGWSEGATLLETAEWLIRFGAWEGLNLDGGGSTAMARLTNGIAVLLNRPSGSVQRVNGNHIGVFALPLQSLPEILAEPQNAAVDEWQPAQFAVQAASRTTMSYQWFLQGDEVPGATAASYSIPWAEPRHAGVYRVRISNADGSVTSAPAMLQVTAQPTRILARGDGSFHQTQVDPASTDVMALASGIAHSLALRTDGNVIVWGNSGLGQTLVPPAATNLISIAAGSYHSLGISSEGRVIAWGANTEGQCDVPAGQAGILAVAAGGVHSLALRRNGTVIAWGDNIFGQTSVPQRVTNAVAIAAGQNHSAAVLRDGTVIAWGANLNENGDYVGQSVPPVGLSNVVAVVAGTSHTLALRSDGTVIGWGDNSRSQAAPPCSATNVVAIAAGASHSLALRQDGTLISWGDNTTGQRAFPPATSFVAIAAGGYNSMALLKEGDLAPKLYDPLREQNSFSAVAPSFARSRYTLQDSSTLTNFVPIQPAVRGNGALLHLRDNSATNPQTFYRLLRED